MTGPSWTADRIRALMGDRTQQQFADALGVHRVTVARWLAGTPPRPLAARELEREAKRRNFLG